MPEVRRSVNPLSTAGDSCKVLTYEQYQERGSIVKTLIDADPVVEKVRTNQSGAYGGLLNGYILKEESYGATYFDEVLPFSDFDIPNETEFARREWDTQRAESRDKSSFYPAVNTSYYNADYGAIVTESMYSTDDGWPIDAPERATASEITWKTWAEVAGRRKIGNLRVNFQDNIVNMGTESVIKEAYKRQNPSLDEMAIGEFAMDPQNSQKQLAFLALLGTDNARPIEYMLKDHFSQTGRQKIQRICVYPFQRKKPGPVKIGWNMVLEIGRDI